MGENNNRRKGRGTIAAAALFLGFGAVYIVFGLTLAATTVFHYNDALFGADSDRILWDLTVRGCAHVRTAFHPLFLLLFNPLGLFLTAVFRSHEAAAVTLTAGAGAGCVALTFRFLLKAGLTTAGAALYAGILGFSAGHLIFSCSPETWVFGALGTIGVFCIATVERPRSVPIFLTAVFAVGMLASNLFHAVVAYALTARKKIGAWKTTWRAALYGVTVGAAVYGLGFIQKAVYPSSLLFFEAKAGKTDLDLYLARLAKPVFLVAKAVWMAMYVAVFNVVAPGLTVRPGTAWRTCLPPIPNVAFDISTSPPVGVLTAALWTAILAWAVVSAARARLWRSRLTVALALCLIFNFAFLAAFGELFFLYAPLSIFLLVALVALALRRHGEGTGLGRFAFYAAPGVFLAAEILHNAYTFIKVIGIFRGHLPAINWWPGG